MDGRATLAEIRKQATLISLPVIAVTASSELGEELELQTQFSGYIRKPFSRRTLFLALTQFLQQAPLKGPLSRGSSSETLTGVPAPLPDHAAQWSELALELRRQEASQWPALRDTLAINATQAFAHRLFTLGQAAHCPALTTYAATLTTFANAYAIGQMESHLGVFPELIKSIETSLAGRAPVHAESIPHV